MARWRNWRHPRDGAPEAVAEPGRRGEGELEVLDAALICVEEARDLEGPGDAEVGDLLGLPSGDVLAVEQDLARASG